MKTLMLWMSFIITIVIFGACHQEVDPATYHLRRHTCKVDFVHNPSLKYDSVFDQGNNLYKTIIIGTQEWMAENLITSIYRNGDPIPNIKAGDSWLQQVQGAWSHYENDPKNECPYGKLYNFYAVKDSRGLCPVGWRVPTNEDWEVLANYLGGLSSAGGKMKSSGRAYWSGDNSGAANSSGFSGLPGGFRTIGVFDEIENKGRWWSGTLHKDFFLGYYWQLSNNTTSIVKDETLIRQGHSVRCIKE